MRLQQRVRRLEDKVEAEAISRRRLICICDSKCAECSIPPESRWCEYPDQAGTVIILGEVAW